MGGDMNPEIKHRTAESNRALAELRTPFFYCEASHQEDRNSVIGPYLWSRLLLNAGTWPELSDAQCRRLNGAYMRVVNAAAAVKYRDGQPSKTARQALQATGQPHVADF